ncbi:unnamed protein product [Sphagnum balticum]
MVGVIVFEARVAKSPSAYKLVIDFSIASEAVPALRNEAMRDATSLGTFIREELLSAKLSDSSLLYPILFGMPCLSEINLQFINM